MTSAPSPWISFTHRATPFACSPISACDTGELAGVEVAAVARDRRRQARAPVQQRRKLTAMVDHALGERPHLGERRVGLLRREVACAPRSRTLYRPLGSSAVRVAQRVRDARAAAPDPVRPGRTVGPAVEIFLWSRAAIWGAAVFALLVFEPNRHPRADRWDDPAVTRDLGLVTDVWARWDSVWFLRIAEERLRVDRTDGGGVLSRVPRSRRPPRARARRALRHGRDRDLARDRPRRLRPPLSPGGDAARRRRRASRGPLSRALPDGVLPPGRLQRVALSLAHRRRRSWPRSAGASSAAGPSQGSRCSRGRPGSPSCPRSRCSPGASPTGAAATWPRWRSLPRCSRSTPSTSGGRSATPGRSCTRRRSGRGTSRAAARSAASGTACAPGGPE